MRCAVECENVSCRGRRRALGEVECGLAIGLVSKLEELSFRRARREARSRTSGWLPQLALYVSPQSTYVLRMISYSFGSEVHHGGYASSLRVWRGTRPHAAG